MSISLKIPLTSSDANTAPHNSKRGREMDLSGATFVLQVSKFVKISPFEATTRMYATPAYAFSEASEKT